MPKRLITAVLALLVLALVALPASAGAKQKPRPGVQVTSPSGQCTANFLFKRGEARFLGQAAHCTGTGDANETNGCDAKSTKLGTKIRVQGAERKGKLVYNSWLAMQEVDERNQNACMYNDFALVKLSRQDAKRSVGRIPYFGGPNGLGNAKTADMRGDRVYSFGHSSARPNQDQSLRRKGGYVLEQSGGGWTRDVYTPNSPGVPGDSGSPFLDEKGNAIGTLSTLQVAPTAGSNGVSDLPKELRYARSHGMEGLKLVRSDKKFDPKAVEVPLFPGMP